MPTPKARFGRLEVLEGRDVPAAPTATIDLDGVVDIYCGNWNDDVTVRTDGNDLVVRILSKPPNNPAHRGNVVNERFVLSDVTQVVFFGDEGNDIFRNSATGFLVAANGEGGNDQLFGGDGNEYLGGGAGDDVLKGGGGNDTIYGEAGKDTIRGGTGDDELHGGSGVDDIRGNENNDTIYGDSGNDYLKGNSGNDSLYGGTGTDNLYGGDHNDGLFGGAGRNYLYGEAGADRYLYRDQRDAREVSRTEDAKIFFASGGFLDPDTKDWTDEEIELVDGGLKLLHDRTGDTRILVKANGEQVWFFREDVYTDAEGPEPDTTGLNSGSITLYDSAFASDSLAVATTIHEMGHFWDEAGEMGSRLRYSDWLGLSNWQLLGNDANGNEVWDFDEYEHEPFALEYGESSPYEDWCTAWEAYFTQVYDLFDGQGLQDIGYKFVLIDGFLNSFVAS